jgi:hypothetical protein
MKGIEIWVGTEYFRHAEMKDIPGLGIGFRLNRRTRVLPPVKI